MAVHDMLCYMGILFLATSQATENTSASGEFNFETSEITNGTFLVKEGTSVNITFTVQRNNSSEIDISKSDASLKIFTPQCKILPTCQHRQSYNKVSCQCLDTPGFYSITFIADRKDNALWKWSSKPGVQDANIFFNVTYPANITRLEMVGYDTYIPKFKAVSVVCTWENGNPSTRVVLRDSNNRVLVASDTSGNVSYTYPHVECSQAGVIRCEADGSEQNMSTAMLVECPPEFVKTAGIQHLSIEQNADVTFLFRSHTLNISSCHVGQSVQSTNGDTNQSRTVFFTCTKADGNVSDVIGENKHCLYSVNGEPPDLHLTIRFRNLKRKDGGLWYVNISNDVGSDKHYIQVTIKVGNDPADVEVKTGQETSSSPVLSPFAIGGIVIGVATFTIIVFIIICLIQRGKDSYARLRRKGKNGKAFYKGLDPDTMLETLSGIYSEIPDAHLETDLQPTERQSSNNCLHLAESMNDNSLENVGHLQHPYDEIEKCKFPDDSKCDEQIKKENTPGSSQNTLDYLEPILTENQTRPLPPASNYLSPISTDNETSNVQQRPEYLKLDNTGSETSNVQQRSEYLKLDKSGSETSKVEGKSEYLKLDKSGSETSKVEGRSEYLKLDKTGSEASNVPQRSEYLKLDKTGSDASKVEQRSEYLKLDHTRHETGSTKQRTKYLKLDRTVRKTNNVSEKSDFLNVAQTDSKTNSEGLRSDYLRPIQTGN